MGKAKAIKKRSQRRELTVKCVWCDEPFDTTREDAKTCSGKCRQRLAAFVNHLGWEPDEPPGEVTAQHAIDLVILHLIYQERTRRMREAAYLKVTGALPPRD